MSPPAGSRRGSTSRRLERSRRSLPFLAPAAPDVRGTLATRLVRESIVAEVSTAAIGLALAVLLWPIVPRQLLVGWLGTIYLITLLRFLVRRRLSTMKLDRAPASMRILIIVGGLAWGLGALLLSSRIPLVDLALVMVIFAGLCAGGITTLLADPPSYYGFLATILTPLALGLAGNRLRPDYGSAATLVVLFGILMAVSYHRAHLTLLKYVRTSNALERSEANAVHEQKFLDQVIASVPAAIAVVDQNERVARVNPAFERLFGFTEAELAGKTLEEFIVPPSGQRRSVQLRSEVIETGSLVEESVRLHKDGHQILTAINAVRVAPGQGNVLVVYEDITERRTRERQSATMNAIAAVLSGAQVEEELAPNVLRAIGENLDWEIGAWWRLDRQQNAARCDEVWVAPDATQPDLAEMIRGSRRSLRDGLVGRVWREWKPAWAGDLASAFAISDEAASEGDWSGSAAAFPIRIDAEVVAVASFYSRKVKEPDPDELDTMSAISTQIGTTKQRLRAEAALRDTESRYRQLVETSADIVWRIDASGRFTFLNNATNHVLGWTPEQLIGRPFASIADAESADRDRVAIAHLLSGEELFGYETVARQPGGGKVHLKVSGRPVREPEGHISGAQGIAHDISLDVATRDALRLARATAQQADAAKSAFLANMSHEIRTPMTGILGTADLILEGELSDEQRKSVQLIVSSAETLLTIINDILDLSKIEAGQLELEATTVDLPKLLHDTVSLMSRTAASKGVALRLETSADLPPLVRGDPTRLRQVLNNLISNAVKFTAHGTVRVSATRVDGAQDTPMIRFAVRDTGIGIAPEALERIFEPFRQADVSTTRTYGGTGLGLSISRRLVQMMGGLLQVDSELERGSDFHFEIEMPIATAEARPEPDRHTPAAPSRALRILVAEDNPVNQQVAGAMLRRRGHTVDIVGNGREAVDAVLTHRYDVVLMDLQMPILDGLNATLEIREREQNRRVPIVALTANAATGEQERCISAGMDAYVSKPFRAADLVSAIDDVTSGRASSASASSQATTIPGQSIGPVDVEGLRAELEDAGAEDALPAVLTVFVGDAPIRLAVINDAIAARDHVRIERGAHAYKSSSGTVRAVELAGLLQDLEHLAKSKGNLTEISVLRDQIVAAHEAAMAQLRSWLATQKR